MLRRTRALLVACLVGAAACGGDDAPALRDGGRDAGSPDAAATGCATECDDGLSCNGVETCVAGSCEPGTPVACDDGSDCTEDTCSEDTGGCEYRSRDADGDGHGDEACGGDDCDDADAERYRGAPEICDAMHDEDCDPT